MYNNGLVSEDCMDVYYCSRYQVLHHQGLQQAKTEQLIFAVKYVIHYSLNACL